MVCILIKYNNWQKQVWELITHVILGKYTSYLVRQKPYQWWLLSMKWAFTRFLTQKYSHTQKSVERNSVKIVFIIIPAPNFHLFIPRVSGFCHYAEKKFCFKNKCGCGISFPLLFLSTAVILSAQDSCTILWCFDNTGFLTFQSFSGATQKYITQSWHLTYFCFLRMNLQK